MLADVFANGIKLTYQIPQTLLMSFVEWIKMKNSDDIGGTQTPNVSIK